jgi:hypothetical protein
MAIAIGVKLMPINPFNVVGSKAKLGPIYLRIQERIREIPKTFRIKPREFFIEKIVF